MVYRSLLEKITKKKWIFDVSRKFNWFVEWGQIQANNKEVQKKYVSFGIPTKNYLILNGDEYYIEDDLKDFQLFFENQLNKDQNFFKKFIKRIFKLEEEVLKFTNLLKKENLKLYSDTELSKLINQFSEEFVKSLIHTWVRPDACLSMFVNEYFKRKSSLTNEEIKNIVPKITTYPEIGKLSYTQEPLDLLLIAQKIMRGGYKLNNLSPIIEKDLKNHINKYSWLKGPVASENVSFKREDYVERLTLMLKKNVDKEIKHILTTRKEVQRNYKDIIIKYKIKGSLLKLCEAVRNFTFLRTYTTENNERLFFVAKTTLLKEISKRTSVIIPDLTMLEPQEISSLLLGKLKKTEARKIIDERKLGFAITWVDGELNTIFAKKSIDLQNKVSFLYRLGDKINNKQVRGTPASVGKAKGTVKIVLSHKDTSKVDEGDILVSSMTNPDFIIAMEKASAFITDEGGITCHAAIVAREFGVPCIVGTINATKVLKDGDFIEVNANKGVVKKI